MGMAGSIGHPCQAQRFTFQPFQYFISSSVLFCFVLSVKLFYKNKLFEGKQVPNTILLTCLICEDEYVMTTWETRGVTRFRWSPSLPRGCWDVGLLLRGSGAQLGVLEAEQEEWKV